MALTIHCASYVATLDEGATSPPGMTPGSWFHAVAGYDFTSTSYGIFNTASLVEPGAACGSGTQLVAMSVSDYNAMIQAANVVTELQHGWDYAVVAVLAIIFLGAFLFGWRLAHGGKP